MPAKFAVNDEDVEVSVAHALKLANLAFHFLKSDQGESAEKVVGILIGYLRGEDVEG